MNNTSNSSSPSQLGVAEFVYLTVDCIGIAINVAVIAAVYFLNAIPAKIPRVFFIHQCVVDGTFCLIGSAWWWMTGWGISVPENIFGDLACRVWADGLPLWTCLQVSTGNSIIFAVERYLSIVRPFVYQKVTMRHVTIAILLCWLIGIGIEIPTIFEGKRDGTHCVPTVIPQPYYSLFGTIVFVTVFAGPLILITALYSHLIVVLFRQGRRMKRQDNHFGKVTRNLAVTVIIASSTKLCLEASGAIMYYLYNLSVYNYNLAGWQYQLNTFLLNLNFIVNPLVFALRMQPLRKALRRLCFRPAHTGELASSATTGTAGAVAQRSVYIVSSQAAFDKTICLMAVD